METKDRILLTRIQAAFPVEERPYQVLGEMLGLNEEETWQRVNQLRQKGMIRRIGGVFDSRRLGYFSTLCAAKVPEEKISILADFLMEVPGVTHNYLRDHCYNMWFTVISRSQVGLMQLLEQAKNILGSPEVYSLPAIRLFKIGVLFDLEKRTKNKLPIANTDYSSQEGRPAFQAREEDKALIRILQGDLAPSLCPFSEAASRLGWSEESVRARIQDYKRDGVLRRFGAILYHRKAGFTSNAMGVWVVPEAQIEETGHIMAAFKEVSHCYQRPDLPDWPYNLFTMIHGHSPSECRKTMERISKVTGIRQYEMLFSHAELKKTSMEYFREEE
ncbi:MAG: Lrp/AsnC family transcriptional regulator [Dehalobacter sp. 4CP]|uniref:siroheme decarboxylase subunit beta n=1 Tax=Dehalobacter sp. CP TaxID=2594474 RepID=UPI0013CB932E|nr:Lrp/AsnC family transcriptional regulator [Dehalobacter sp. 4CP]